MKKSLLLVMAALGFAAASVNAETLNLTFNRTGTTYQTVTVNTSGVEGVTASMTSSNQNLKGTNGNVTSAIVCPDVNATSSPTITLKFQVNGLAAGTTLESVDLDIHALNGSSAYQANNDNKVRLWNVSVVTDAATVGSKTDIDIAAGVGSAGAVHKDWNFAPSQTLALTNPVTFTITITKGTTNEGCFFGLSAIKLNLGESSVDPDPIDPNPDKYCIPTQTTDNVARYLKDFTLTGENDNTVNIKATQAGPGRPIFKDATTTVFTANQGEEISIVGTGSESAWMGQWLYIDFNNDGFSRDEIKLDSDYAAAYGNDLVSFNSVKDNVSDTFYNSWGNVSGGDVAMNTEQNERSHMPAFNIPGYLAPGDYRARYILQFSSLNPCGVFDAVKADDNITNGGTIIDFMIHVEKSDFTVNINSEFLNESTGEVIVAKGIDENGNPVDVITDGTVVEGGTELHLFVSHDDESRISKLLLANGRFHGKEYTKSLAKNADEFETLADGTVHYSFLVNGNVKLDATISKNVPVTYTVAGRGSAQLATEISDVKTLSATSSKIIAGKPAGVIVDSESDVLYVLAGTTVHVFATPDEENQLETIIVGNTSDFTMSFAQGDKNLHFLDTDGDNNKDTNYISFVVPESEDEINVSITFATDFLEIESVINDVNSGSAQAYDLRGIKVDANNLVRGNVYILRSGNTIQKVLVK